MKKLEVEIFVQDWAENKEGKNLTFPMKNEDLEKALKPYEGEEIYKEYINANGFGTGQELGNICDRLNIYEFNELVKYFNDNEIYNTIDLLFYANDLGLMREIIKKIDSFNSTIAGLGWSASEILTQVEEFNFDDDYFIIDENNFIYSVDVHELQNYADGEAWDLVKKLFDKQEIAA